jgi:hypothetical protein
LGELAKADSESPSPQWLREVDVLIPGGRAWRNRRILRAVGLGDGEVVEVVSIAYIGSFKVVVVGDAGTAIRPSCGVVLTDRRLILVEASARTGRMLGVSADMPRQHLARSEVRVRAFLSFDVFYNHADPLRLSFPLPNRAEGRQVAAALPVWTVGT